MYFSFRQSGFSCLSRRVHTKEFWKWWPMQKEKKNSSWYWELELGIWTMRFFFFQSLGEWGWTYSWWSCVSKSLLPLELAGPSEVSCTFRFTWNVKMEYCMESPRQLRHLETRNATGGHLVEWSWNCDSPAREVLNWAPGTLQGADPALPVEVLLTSDPGNISDQWTEVRKVSHSMRLAFG